MDKAYILSEIKRTAAENGGRPLGVDSFREATGIRRAVWEGRYWARWSEAVAEAGYEPNKLVTAYDDESLLELYVSLVRRYGRPPVNTELRLAWHHDRYPNPKTFSAHFGNRASLIAKVREFCQVRTGHDDVLAMLGPAREGGPRLDASSDQAVLGTVYLLKSGRYYKIGRTNSRGRREYEIALQLPERASLVHEIRTDDPAGIEAYWHRRYADRRRNGEWFELTADDVAAFRRRKFM